MGTFLQVFGKKVQDMDLLGSKGPQNSKKIAEKGPRWVLTTSQRKKFKTCTF